MNKITLLSSIFFFCFACTQPKIKHKFYKRHDPKNRLPKEVEDLLATAKEGILYELGRLDGKKGKRIVRNHRAGREKQLSSSEMRLVAEGLFSAINEWYGIYVFCFSATHILRIQSDNKTHDFIISYNCNRLLYYQNGKKIHSVGLDGERNEKVLYALTHNAPRVDDSRDEKKQSAIQK